MIKYDYPDYAASRLVGTVVTYKGDPVLVENILSDGISHLQDLKSGDMLVVDMNDLDTTPVPLGFVNKNKTCVYICRSPKRNDWKQGMRYENIVSITNLGRSALNGISYKEISSTIMGKFPSLSTCFKNVSTGKHNKQAFSRDFCFCYLQEDVGKPTVSVEYGGFGVVGTYSEEGFNLSQKYKYLKERLEEYVGK